eukprot:CAMPEP_0113604530 /NCGR_PEP_ID=MMETSP0017_2-20120614/1842_1 /TAXON_ID=2856 /ORGANISM="Cylindrotheca closterium" /LENGTH=60 /DNA_ID=CAMNT_0000512957 /DNA_START=954 /DNA_END=1132 /DNA_ORIENTATION=+ /assembly_acc=CAM_ASM_000147
MMRATKIVRRSRTNQGWPACSILLPFTKPEGLHLPLASMLGGISLLPAAATMVPFRIWGA